MELRLPLEVSPGREAICGAVFGTWGSFPDDARAGQHLRIDFIHRVDLGRRPGIGFLPRGDREIGVLRNVEAPTRPRLECRRITFLTIYNFLFSWSQKVHPFLKSTFSICKL